MSTNSAVDVNLIRQLAAEAPQPDANGEFATPADGAKFMAGTYQIPQIPLRGKAPFFGDWQDKGSTDFAQIDAWYAEYGCNFGSICKDTPDGKFAVEVDSPDVSKRIKESGAKFTSEVIIGSRPGRGHRWYLQSAESIQLGNISQSNVTNQDFSVRVSNEQCVSPGSVHPVSKKQYKVISRGPIAIASSQELQWLKSQKISGIGKKDVPEIRLV